MTERGPVAAGARRAVAFGGGGEWFLAWMLGYAHGLRRAGVDLALADATVGTSAGAIVGAAVMGGNLDGLMQAMRALAEDPTTANATLNISTGAASQARARDVMGSTDRITPGTLREIGRAAMAARNAPADSYARSVGALLGLSSWPAGHHVTCTDCYTGESLIADASSGISIAQAAAASSSLPGVNGPTWLGDRLCMDGGVSASSTHAEMLAGAASVVIIGMFDFAASPPQHVNPSFGIAERVHPGTAEREADALRTRGSAVHVTIAGPDPGTDFMDPAAIGSALADGAARGAADAPSISTIW